MYVVYCVVIYFHSYPAGFVVLFSLFYAVTDHGRNVAHAQWIFAFIYLLNLLVVVQLYSRFRKVSCYHMMLSCVYLLLVCVPSPLPGDELPAIYACVPWTDWVSHTLHLCAEVV